MSTETNARHLTANDIAEVVGLVNSGILTQEEGRRCLAREVPPISAPVAQPRHIERRACELWCGSDLPPEGKPGWGFLLSDDADIVERFKLGRAGFVKRDLFIGWCTYECREDYISKTGFRDADAPETGCPVGCVMCQSHAPTKSTPVQEAPKAAPVCCDPFRNSVHHIEVLKRTWKTIHPGGPGGAWTLRTDWLCSLCLQENEPAGGGSEVLHDDRIPALIDRRLAVDWVEDCLGDVR